MTTGTGNAAAALSSITIGDGLVVGRIGYGAMQLTGPQVWGEYLDRDGAIALLRHVVDSGVTLIDTADVYGPHSNEILIHDALYPYPDHLVIATKGGYVRGGYDYSTLDAVGNRNYLRQSAHMSARRLGVETVDLYYLHGGQATDAPFEDQIATLAELRDQGVIRNIGLSNVTVEQFQAARAIVDIAAATAHYNLTNRLGGPLLAAAEAASAMFSPWHPATIGDSHAHAVVATIAEHHQATPKQVALAWHLHTSPLSVPIPGTTSIDHFDENLAAARVALSPDEVESLSSLATTA
ncbi:MAG: pyridoxine 4-dehydrogenase [Frankiales bacterium]|jgi:aryl-alcohol dehydrogenase-like predicted oxidoreductase|nr:pyridoxine 4-dehydrogenase [Frankiales bacterium]